LGGQDGEAVDGEGAGHAADELGSVGGDDGEPAVLGKDSDLTVRHEPALLVGGERRRHDDLVAGEAGVDARHQSAHQGRLPRVPRHRTRRQAVSFGEGVEELQELTGSDGAGDRRNGGGGVEVSAGGHVRQQEMQADHRLQGFFPDLSGAENGAPISAR
jgi:hypothetical protein